MSENKNNYTVFKLSASIPSYPTFAKDNRGWIKYGANNDLPQKLIDLTNESAVNKSIIENKVTYICGLGVDDSIYIGQPNQNENWDDLIEKISYDYVMFGGFCFQVILNENGKNTSLYHTDFSKVRIGDVNDFGMPQNFYLSSDWKKTNGKYAPTEVLAYGSEELKKGTPYLFYFRDYAPNLEFYPIPSYYSALNYIESDGLLGVFYRNSINNGFNPSAIITIPSNPDNEAKERFNKDMTASFSGTNGANSIVVLYGESQEIKPVITPFVASNNADLYNNVNDIIFQKIITAHQLTSPTLAGLSGSGNLSGNANEIINAYILYNHTVIRKLRRKILDVLNVFSINNGYPRLVIKEMDIVKEIRETEIKETEETETVKTADNE